MSFEIGENIIVKQTGDRAEIIDKLVSQKGNGDIYIVKYSYGEILHCGEDDIKALDKSLFEIGVEITENLVIARLYYEGEQIHQSHGHIFHDGAEGIVQAASYALKKMWNETQENEEKY